MTHDAVKGGANVALPDREVQIDMFRRMTLISKNDEAARKAIRTGRLIMPYYSPKGQEVIPAAISVNLNDDDQICTIYRGTHDMLAKGVPLKDLWAEMAGRVTGTCKGKGGPMHITHPASGAILTTGIVGSSMPIANGLAWAHKLDGSRRVAVANFGDGASNIGAFHESLNMASLWKLPVIFVCQNNRYCEHTAYDVVTAVDQISKRAVSYGMPGITVDGNDPFAMYAAAHEAVNRARDGEGPTLIEAMTFRFYGHVFGDDSHYIPKEEMSEAKANDPLVKYRARLLETGTATEDQLASIEADIAGQIEEAIKYALDSDLPSLDELVSDVYAEAGAA